VRQRENTNKKRYRRTLQAEKCAEQNCKHMHNCGYGIGYDYDYDYDYDCGYEYGPTVLHTLGQIDGIVLALHAIARQRGREHLFPRGGDGGEATLFGACDARGLVDGVRLCKCVWE
jgi:hypothetical protein